MKLDDSVARIQHGLKSFVDWRSLILRVSLRPILTIGMGMILADKNSAIYKICLSSEWRKAMQTGAYAGSVDDQRDGFIHLSTVQQLRGTADKHFAGQMDLVLISINSASLGDQLKWEPSRGGQLFPHCYGDLPVTSAVAVHPLPLDIQGRHIFPDDVHFDDARNNEASNNQQTPTPITETRETD